MVMIRGVSLKTTKMTTHHVLLLCCKKLDSVPYLLVLFSFFQKALGSAVGILAAALHLHLEGRCIFHCMVQYVISLTEQKCFYQTLVKVCNCSALGEQRSLLR